MTDHFQTEPLGPAPERPLRPTILSDHPQLPGWLARRLLRWGEVVTWVRGPRFTPSWEVYVTHPALFFAALVIGAGCLLVGSLTAGGWGNFSAVAALAVVLGSIFVLGIACGHFTRLVVTNLRLFIVQGRELCGSWNVDDLPPHLVRYGRRGDDSSRTVDLDAVKTMLGGNSDRFVEAKTIVEFGRKLEQIKLQGRRLP